MGRKSKLKKQRRQWLEQTLFDYAYSNYLELGRGLVNIIVRQNNLDYVTLKDLETVINDDDAPTERNIVNCLRDYKPEKELVILVNYSGIEDEKISLIVLAKYAHIAICNTCDIPSIFLRELIDNGELSMDKKILEYYSGLIKTKQ